MDALSALAAGSYARARTAAAPAPSPAFNLGAVVEDFAATLNQHEATARAAMTGTADPHALVEALAASQTAIETVATLRDRVVEAYQEILRMPV